MYDECFRLERDCRQLFCRVILMKSFLVSHVMCEERYEDMIAGSFSHNFYR